MEIALPARNGSIRGVTVVDAADAEWLGAWLWRLSERGYAVRFDNALGRQVYMHRELLGLKLGDPRIADHINRDKLDNRRANLRSVTPAQSNHNLPSYRGSTSMFRGVCWDRRAGRWHAYAQLNRRQFFLGYYDAEEEAASAAATWRAEHMPFSREALVA